MTYSNQISTSIPDRDLKEILDAVNFIDRKLPDLVKLSNEELDALPKMRNNTIEFVLENLKEAEARPELIPDDVELDEVRKDVELIRAIYKILNPLKNLEKKRDFLGGEEGRR